MTPPEDFIPPDPCCAGQCSDRCRFDDSAAVAVFAMDQGCVCYPDDREQALCMQHIVRATPLGSLTLVRDLTLDAEFTRWWAGR